MKFRIYSSVNLANGNEMWETVYRGGRIGVSKNLESMIIAMFTGVLPWMENDDKWYVMASDLHDSFTP